MIVSVSLDWLVFREELAGTDVRPKVLLDEFTDLAISLVEIVHVVDERPFLRVVIHREMADREVLVDQLESRHPKAKPDENHWAEEVHHEAPAVSRHHQSTLLQQGPELSAEIPGMVL